MIINHIAHREHRVVIVLCVLCALCGFSNQKIIISITNEVVVW